MVAGFFAVVVEVAGCFLPMVCLGFDGDGFSGAVVASGGVVVEVLGSVGGIVTGGVCVCCSGGGVLTVGACACGTGTGGFCFLQPAANNSVNARTKVKLRR